jgi:hypothetical protein
MAVKLSAICAGRPLPPWKIFINSHSGGWSLNWVQSVRRPLIGLLYLPRVIVRMENLVKWRLAWETELLGENLPQRHFIHHKSHLTRPGLEPGPPRWEAGDCLSYGAAPSGRFLVLISVRGWVNPRAIVRLEGLGQLKNPMKLGMERATFRLVSNTGI